MIIQLSHVSKYYTDNGKSTKGIEDVSLTLKTDGSFVVITGESGAGKSTLIRILTGLEDFDEGEITFDGVPVSQFSEEKRSEFYRKNISFVFQDYNLVESFTAEENIILALAKQGYSFPDARKKAREVLAEVGLGKEAKMRSSKLSGGERQRVAIARSLALDTKVIIFDEPTGNLDQKTSQEIIELIDRLRKDRLVVYVTHEFPQVKDYVTRHIILSDGHVIRDEEIRKPVAEGTLPPPVEKPRHRFSTLLKTSALFTFRRPGRFIATFLILLLSIAGFFGLGMNYAATVGLFATRGTVGYRLGNEVLLKKKSVDEDDPDLSQDVLQDPGALDYNGIEFLLPSDRLGARESDYADTLQVRLTYCLPEDFSLKEGTLDRERPLFLYPKRSRIEGEDVYQVLMGKINTSQTLVPQTLVYSFDLGEGAVKSLPSFSPAGIGTCDSYFVESATDNRTPVLYLPKATYASYLSALRTAALESYAGVPTKPLSLSLRTPSLQLTPAENSPSSLTVLPDNALVLSDYWKGRNDLTIAFKGFECPISSFANVIYVPSDPENLFTDYNYITYGDPVGKEVMEKKLVLLAHFPSIQAAKDAYPSLEKDYSVTYLKPMGIKTQVLGNTIAEASKGVRIASFFGFLGELVFALLIGLLIRFILNKFYFRKANDEMVLSYLGYGRRDLYRINFVSLFTTMLVLDVAFYALVISLVPAVRTTFLANPWFFVMTFLLSLLYSGYLSLPLKTKKRAR